MCTDHLHGLLLGSPHVSITGRDSRKPAFMLKRNQCLHPSFIFFSSGQNKYWHAGSRRLLPSGRSVVFPSILSSTRRQFRINFSKEQFTKNFALVRSRIPYWMDGLFLVRCSVFTAVISAVGTLAWYAQLKAKSFVETQVLPSICSILSEYIQREIEFGRVQNISPLGFTVQACSVGPHCEEFSCGEVSSMKIRVRPFASLSRGKIVINAFLSQPNILVSQKEDFSWLGIPSPPDHGLPRHHSSEEGIDYRTKIRRLAREESVACWSKERVNAAREAAEIGYIVPQGNSVSCMDDASEDGHEYYAMPGASNSFRSLDEKMHWKGNHGIDIAAKSSLKHADLEKSFGVKTPSQRQMFMSKIITNFMRRKFKQDTCKRLSSESCIIAKQRNLKHSAAAARVYFQGPASCKTDEMCTKQGGEGDPSNEGFEDSEAREIRPTNEKTDSAYEISVFDKDCSEVRFGDNEEKIIWTDQDCVSAQLTRVEKLTRVDSYKDGSKENDNTKEDNCSGQQSDGLGFLSIPSFVVNNRCISIQHFIMSFPFDPVLHLCNSVLDMNLCFSDWTTAQVHKFKSLFGMKRGDIATELLEGADQTEAKGIENILPVTVDSVYFDGGTLMLLGYGDKEPREMVNANGFVKFRRHYSQVHVQLSGDCMGWRTGFTSQNGGHLIANVFVDAFEQQWHANLKISSLFAPLFERIIDIPITWSQGRASGEVHICMSTGDSFPNIYGQLDVKGLSFQIFDAPSSFSEIAATLYFRGQRVFLHNTSGCFGDAPLEASGDFGINPDDGEFHLMCQVPSVEVNALMKTLKMRPLMFSLAGSVTAIFNCQGPLDAPVFVGSGIVSRKSSYSASNLSPTSASEAVIKNKEAGAVAAFDRIPFSHVSANFTYNLDNSVADLYGIRATLLDGGEIRGAGNAWICLEGEVDDTAMDVNFSGKFSFDKVLKRYLPEGAQLTPFKFGQVNAETKLSGSLLKPRFDIKWAAPEAEDSFSDARGDIVISHELMMVSSSAAAFDLYAKIQTCYLDDCLPFEEKLKYQRIMSLIIEGIDLDLRMRGFELASLISYTPFVAPRQLHLKATGRFKFQGKVIMPDLHLGGDEKTRLLGDLSLSGVKLNQLLLAPQLAGSLSISHDSIKLDAMGRPDERLTMEIIGALTQKIGETSYVRKSLSISLQKGQLKANVCYEPQKSANLEVRNLTLDELELASLRGAIQRAELQLNFQKRRGHGMLSMLHPKFSGVLGEALDVVARWSGDVVSSFFVQITVEKAILQQACSRYEIQGEYVLPGIRDRHSSKKKGVGFLKRAMAGHLGSVISSMGRWRMRLEVPGAEVSEMLPLARLLSRSTDPAVQFRSKDFFILSVLSDGFHAESLRDLLGEIRSHYNWSEENILEDIALPGLAEFRGHWRGSLDASGGGNGDTMADFDFHGEDWEWGTYKTQRVIAAGAYSNNDGLRLEKLFIRKENATLHADGTLLGPVSNLHFAVLNFPVGLVPTLVQIIESSTMESVHSLRQVLSPIKGILHMEGDLRGSLAKPECDVQIRLLDGAIGGIDLGRAEIAASLTENSRFLFNANFEPVIQSGHVHIQGSIPVTYSQEDSVEEVERDVSVSALRHSLWVKESERTSAEEANEKKAGREKNEEVWDIQLSESLKGLNWNLLDHDEVRINANIKDGGMMLMTALSPYANWLHGYADIDLQVRGTVEQPVVDGSASFHRASVSSPVLRKPLTNFGGTVHIISNRICINSMESRISRKGKLMLKGNLPLKPSESSISDKIEIKCEVLEVRAKNTFSGQVDSEMQIMGSILQPIISGMIKLSHGEAYLPHDKGNGDVNKLASKRSTFSAALYSRHTASGHVSRFFGSLSGSLHNIWPETTGKQSDVEKLGPESTAPVVDVQLSNLKLVLGPELRIVYPLILNFAVSGELELDGVAQPQYIKPKGILTFENGDVNLVATQVRLKRDHVNVAKFEPDLGLDPILDLALVGSEWQFRIQSRASSWQDNLIVTSTRSVDQNVLTPGEAARVFESQLAESLLEGDGQLAFKKLATATLETLMPRIEGKGEFGQARWRLVYAPQIPSLLSVDPTVDPLKSLASNISFGTEVEVQLGKRLQASVVRQMKDSEMAMQWTFIYQLTKRLRVLFQSTPSNRLLFEYSTISQN
ncbi:hypothetical protein AXF42_Ash018167 [Apostasia shenzhenica]|uniref:Translocation and assembly module TamB C-terminal domain-containing protein n=1 Tax=Apostasia shenzhenica TaxID=1088818 RepID=A0A2I0AF37_9ASPA|nr:hypothetical protein AXF42_Ash018167 [Apostasia shenzhenica]